MTPIDPNTPVTLVVTAAEVNVIGEALGRLPFDHVVDLIMKLREQAKDQLPPPPAKT